MRGEYISSTAKSAWVAELPPRARRIPEQGLAETRRQGTTSACAENTMAFILGENSGGNYLRVRGEYNPWCGSWTAHPELPPRARRIHVRQFREMCYPGTTSACAENTRSSFPPTPLTRNYLRVRGEYRRSGNCYRRLGELPPRARRILLLSP